MLPPTSSRSRQTSRSTRHRRRHWVWPGTLLLALPRCTPRLRSKTHSTRVSATLRSMPTSTSGNFQSHVTLSLKCPLATMSFRLAMSELPSDPSGCESASYPMSASASPPGARTEAPHDVPSQHRFNNSVPGCTCQPNCKLVVLAELSKHRDSQEGVFNDVQSRAQLQSYVQLSAVVVHPISAYGSMRMYGHSASTMLAKKFRKPTYSTWS